MVAFNDASPDVTSYAKWGDSAIGLRAIASGGNATALGRSATATAANAIAIGGGNGDSATDNTEKQRPQVKNPLLLVTMLKQKLQMILRLVGVLPLVVVLLQH